MSKHMTTGVIFGEVHHAVLALGLFFLLKIWLVVQRYSNYREDNKIYKAITIQLKNKLIKRK